MKDAQDPADKAAGAADTSADNSAAAGADAAGDAAANAQADATTGAAAAGDGAIDADATDVDAADATAVEDTVEDKLLAQVQELTADLQRVSAEFANYRKRVSRDISMASHNGKADVIAALLPITDDVDRARQHGDLDTNTALKAFSDKFLGVLQAQNAEEFGAEGELFDANTHEAIQDEGGDGEKIISAVLRKGYRLGDRVLRSALVIVRGDEGATAAAAAAADEASATGDDAEGAAAAAAADSAD